MADSTLSTIRTKIRRLTRSPSPQQITNDELDDYINTFVLYDFPEHLRLFSLRSTLTFYTEPNIDFYDTNTVNQDHPLYDFKNRYITTHQPVYVAGYEALFSQSSEQFFGMYPFTNSISTGTTGDGITTGFAGTLPAIPVLQGNVLFTSIDVNGTGIALQDDPIINGATGIPTQTGDLIVPNDNTTSYGTINYVTGVYDFNFPTAPAAGEDVSIQVVPYVAARPQSLLYFNNAFVLRPVPDQVYAVVMEVYKQPTSLLNDSDVPELDQWWQYIAYGASKKVFEDRMDIESVVQIMPEFKQQERLILRRTIVQQTKERTATIYTQQVDGVGGNNWNNNY